MDKNDIKSLDNIENVQFLYKMRRLLFVLGALELLSCLYCNAEGSFRIPISVVERSENASLVLGDVFGVGLRNYEDIEYYGR